MHQGDLLVILIAVVQSGSEQIQNDFTKAQMLLMEQSESHEGNMCVINVLNHGLAFFESTDDAFHGKMYKMAKRNTGSGFPLLFSHLQVMFKLHNQVLSHFEKHRPVSQALPQLLSKNITDQFSIQLQNANKKLEEFVLMLLDSFHLSMDSSNSRKVHAPQQSSQIVIRLTVEIINCLSIIKNKQLRDQVIESCVRYFYRMPLSEREIFVHRITMQFEQILSKKEEIAEKNITSMIQLLHTLLAAKRDEELTDVELIITNDFCLRLLNIMLTGYSEQGLKKRDPMQKRRKDSKQAVQPLTVPQLYNMMELLRLVLRSKCNLHTTKGSVGMQQSTVINLRLANRICQVISYSFLPKGKELANELSTTSTLKSFVLSSDDEDSVQKKDLIYDLIQFVGLNYSDQTQDLPAKKNDQLIKKLIAMLNTLSQASFKNLQFLVPILL